MAEVSAEQGLRGATAAQVAKRAGVSRSTLSQHFDGLDDCFVALLDWMLERATEAMVEAYKRESDWEDGVLAGLEALLVLLDSEPVCARACLLESLTGLPARFQARAEKLGQIALFVDVAAREQLDRERQPSAMTPEAVVASVLGILRRRLLSGDAPPFVGLLDQLVEVVVAPYFGPSAAAEAAGRGRDRARALLAQRPAGRTLEEVELPDVLRHARSHRLRACLEYLASNPHSCNRDIAEGIGVSHSGQISLLLARLQDDGLLVNEGGGPGHPNAWCLSDHGVDVAQALRRRSKLLPTGRAVTESTGGDRLTQTPLGTADVNVTSTAETSHT